MEFLKPFKLKTIDYKNYWWLKTLNGKYYQSFIEQNRVQLYNYKIDSMEKHLTDKKNNLKYRQLLNFVHEVNIGDVIIIPSFNHRRIHYGYIASISYLEGQILTRKVDWQESFDFKVFNQKYHKLLYSNQSFVCVNALLTEFERLFYKIYIKNDKLHINININQKNNILGKSLYGLQQLIFRQCEIDELEIKINVQSPGLIEFISSNLEVIIIIFKVINLIKTIQKYYQQKEANDKINQLIKENEKVIEDYFYYKIDKLNIEVPDVNYLEIIDYFEK